MDTRFLKSLIAVVETGSIAGAARRQGLTATAVSQRIRVLEDEFGTPLLSREARSAKPTAACLGLLPRARQLVLDAARLTGELEEGGLTGILRLGAISTALYDYVPSILTAFREQATKAELSIRPGSSKDLFEELMNGDLDAAILVSPPFALPKVLRSETLANQPLVHIAPALAADRDKATIETEDLPWIAYDRTSWGGQIVWAHFAGGNPDGRIICELDSLETIAFMVEQGLGQAIVPAWSGLAARHPGLERTPVPMGETAIRQVVFLSNTDPDHSPLLALAVQAVRQA